MQAPIAPRTTPIRAICRPEAIVNVPSERMVISAHKKRGRANNNSKRMMCPPREVLPHLKNLLRTIPKGSHQKIAGLAKKSSKVSGKQQPCVKVRHGGTWTISRFGEVSLSMNCVASRRRHPLSFFHSAQSWMRLRPDASIAFRVSVLYLSTRIALWANPRKRRVLLGQWRGPPAQLCPKELFDLPLSGR